MISAKETSLIFLKYYPTPPKPTIANRLCDSGSVNRRSIAVMMLSRDTNLESLMKGTVDDGLGAILTGPKQNG
jgi:hypothetical protein